jgi:nickel-dependent lactate racemase
MTDALRIKLPAGWQLTTVGPDRSLKPIDLAAATRSALQQPLSSPRLSGLVSPDARVCIVFTDATRACPDHILVPAILAELEAAGARDENITLLCATGLHRSSSQAEKIAKLGQAVVDRYKVIDHDAAHAVILSEAKNLYTDQHSTPAEAEILRRSAPQNDIAVNPLLLQSDLIIATGVVEPHQYAGYSGGSKTVVIGCGGEATIGETHGPKYLDQAGVRLGKVDGNPFQQFVRDAARSIGLKFVVNVVLDGDGQPVAVRAGDPIGVHDELIAIAKKLYEVPVDRQFDVVIAKVDPPKDVNLYQASRAATYIGLSATPPIRSGGTIIVEARCIERTGQGVGEIRFFEALAGAANLNQVLSRFRLKGCRAGEQRAFMLAQVLLKYEVIIAGSDCPDAVEACQMTAENSIDAAIDRIKHKIGEQASVLYLPHPLITLPIVKSGE